MSNITWQLPNLGSSLIDRHLFLSSIARNFVWTGFAATGTLFPAKHLSANIRRDRRADYINHGAGILCHLGADMV